MRPEIYDLRCQLKIHLADLLKISKCLDHCKVATEFATVRSVGLYRRLEAAGALFQLWAMRWSSYLRCFDFAGDRLPPRNHPREIVHSVRVFTEGRIVDDAVSQGTRSPPFGLTDRHFCTHRSLHPFLVSAQRFHDPLLRRWVGACFCVRESGSLELSGQRLHAQGPPHQIVKH